jgi:hypothetical protein
MSDVEKAEIATKFYTTIYRVCAAYHELYRKDNKMDGPRDDFERRLLEIDGLVSDGLNGEPYDG